MIHSTELHRLVCLKSFILFSFSCIKNNKITRQQISHLYVYRNVCEALSFFPFLCVNKI